MFDRFRRALEDALNGDRSPAGRREAIAQMKETLALARVGLDDLRAGVRQSQARLAAERRELETVQRRKALAANIGDRETVAVAERFERHAAERVAVLERKIAAQEGEVALAEADVETMRKELKAAIAGVPGAGGAAPAGEAAEPDPLDADAAAAAEIDALSRRSRRAAREASADERLADLKRRMGK
jgi:phage shock protein A